MKQLNLFPRKYQTETFDFTYYPNGDKQSVYLRREVPQGKTELETVLIIGSLNLLGQPLGVLFRFYTGKKDPQFSMFNDTVLPELAYMTIDEIKAFAERVIINYKNNLYVWDYEHRCNIFKLVLGESDYEYAATRGSNYASDLYYKSEAGKLHMENIMNNHLAEIRKKNKTEKV